MPAKIAREVKEIFALRLKGSDVIMLWKGFPD